MRIPLIVHERIGAWSRQLRPRVAGWEVRLVESRSGDDLAEAAALSPAPLVLIDPGTRPRSGIEDMARAARIAHDALILMLDPAALLPEPALARELGATHVVSGAITPPEVVALLARWLPLARRRAEAVGWFPEPATGDDGSDLISVRVS